MSEEEAPLILPKRRLRFPFIIREETNDNEPFPLLKLLFPRLHALIMFFLGGFTRKARSRYRITRIDRTETGGWEIFEYEY